MALHDLFWSFSLYCNSTASPLFQWIICKIINMKDIIFFFFRILSCHIFLDFIQVHFSIILDFLIFLILLVRCNWCIPCKLFCPQSFVRQPVKNKDGLLSKPLFQLAWCKVNRDSDTPDMFKNVRDGGVW